MYSTACNSVTKDNLPVEFKNMIRALAVSYVLFFLQVSENGQNLKTFESLNRTGQKMTGMMGAVTMCITVIGVSE